jgi:3-oxoacyl-[acyl-carrier protein] reductase
VTASDPAPAVLLTGATGGIGSAVAAVLVQAGCAVTLAGRSPERLGALADALLAGARRPGATGAGPGERPRIVCSAVDLTEPGAPAALVDAHLHAHGRLDVLVDCAGRGWVGAVGAMGDDDLARVLRVDVEAPFALVRAALPALRTAGAAHGRALVVLVASLAGVRAAAGFAAYSAAKAAVVSLARSVTLEEAAAGVRATAVCPGFVDTPLTARLEGVGRSAMLPASDVAAAVDFLLRLSPAAAVPEIVLGRLDAGPDRP